MTDTNQASEDEATKSKVDWSTPYDEWLKPILNRFRYGGAIECRAIPSEIQLNIESLIRTEKLKLLAEVRVRVVGEDVDLTAEHIRKSFTTKEIPLLMANRQLRNDQRTELTKLEAEL